MNPVSDPEPTFLVKKGECLAVYAFDVGIAIDLDTARRNVLGVAGLTVGGHRPVPKYFDYNPQPVTISCAADPIKLGLYQTAPAVEFLVYDFGGVSVSFSVTIEGPLGELVELTRELSDSKQLFETARRQVESIMASLGDAVVRPSIADVVEDYFILMVDDYESTIRPSEIPVRMGQVLARVLRAELQELSEQEVADAIACRSSYAQDDITVIDWNAALVVDRDRDAEDIRSVLDAANMELLEMRHLDKRLDQSLDESYEVVSPRGHDAPRLSASRSYMQKIAQLQLDGAVLFERVSNAFKLLGDQYLARVYRLASQRFHLPEWTAGILRRLDAIEGLYKKISDRASARTMELLEWIIIVLFVLDIIIIVWTAGK